jgi:hypothetical protein
MTEHCPTISGEILKNILSSVKDNEVNTDALERYAKIFHNHDNEKSQLVLKPKSEILLFKENTLDNELFSTEKKLLVKVNYEELIPKEDYVLSSHPKINNTTESIYLKIAYNKHKMNFLKSQIFLLDTYLDTLLSHEMIKEKRGEILSIICDDPDKYTKPDSSYCNNPLIDLLGKIDTVISEAKFYLDRIGDYKDNYE